MTDKADDLRADIESIIPGDKSSLGPRKLRIAGRTFTVEQFSTYKVLETQRLIGEISETIDFVLVVAQLRAIAQEREGQLELMAYLLPKLMAEVPHLIVRWVALAITPNDELERLYSDGGPGAIAEHLDKEVAWLYFHTQEDQLLTLAEAYIDSIGLDAILKKVLGLAEKVGDTIGLESIGLGDSSPPS